MEIEFLKFLLSTLPYGSFIGLFSLSLLIVVIYYVIIPVYAEKKEADKKIRGLQKRAKLKNESQLLDEISNIKEKLELIKTEMNSIDQKMIQISNDISSMKFYKNHPINIHAD